MDISIICRFCFSAPRKSLLTPIFNRKMDITSYELIISEATGVMVKQNDDSPQNICKKCSNKLKNIITFRKLCKNTQKKIRKILEKNELHLNDTENILQPTENLDLKWMESCKEPLSSGPQVLGPGSEGLKGLDGPRIQINFGRSTFESKTNEPHTSNESIEANEADIEIKVEPMPENAVSSFDESYLNENTLDNSKFKPILPIKDESMVFEEGSDSNENTKILTGIDSTFEMNHTSNKNTYETDSAFQINNTEIDSILCKNVAPITEIPTQNNGKNSIPVLPTLVEKKLPDQTTINKKRVQCEICLKNLSVKSMYGHMSRFHSQNQLDRIRCDICSIYVADIDLHKKEHINLDWKSKMENCDVCNKFMLKSSIRMHKLMKHSNMRPVCAHCGKNFGNKNRLKEHLRAKHGYEKFKCSSCEYTSANKTAMQDHERLHKGEKPYVCETCGAKFHARYLLAQHKHSHREKNVTCNKCPAVFKTNNSLHMHKSACHDSSIYSCQICARNFRGKIYVKKHLRITHKFKGPDFPFKEVLNED